MIHVSNEGICVEVGRKKTHNIGLPTFKLQTSTKTRLRLPRYILLLTSSVYDY